LTYFNGRGLAELSRLIFAEAGVEYVDNRIQDNTELKKSGKLPFGQVPILEYNGQILAQSRAIARFLSRLYGFYGKTEWEGAQIDMILDGVVDFVTAQRAAKTVRTTNSFFPLSLSLNTISDLFSSFLSQRKQKG
jgi:glutathione S-transferase